MSAPVPVCFVIDSLGRGGAEQVLVTLANGLDRARFGPFVVTTRTPGVLASELSPDVKLYSLDRSSRLDLGAFLRFARFVDNSGIRILHSHSHTSSYFINLARRLSSHRWIHIFHDHHGPIHSSRTLQLADKLLLKPLDYAFAVSEDLLAYDRSKVGIPANQSEYLPNGVPIPPLRERSETPERFTVLHTGRIVSPKNQRMAIDVAARVKQAIPNLRWQFAGRLHDTGYGQECLNYARSLGLEGTVEFLGERTDITALLTSANAGVLTSSHEGLPVSLLEYFSEALPVVVTDCGACRKIVTSAGGGEVVPVNDVEGFASALLRIAADRSLALSYGARNRAYVEANFSASVMVNRVMTVYDDLLRAG